MSVLTTWGSANQSGSTYLGDDENNDFSESQGFQVPNASTIQSVELYLVDDVTPPTDDITVRLETDSTGKPSGTLISANATGIITAASVTGSYQFLSVAFSPGIEVAGTTQYHIVASVPAQATGVRFIWGVDATDGAYASGTRCYKIGAGSWTTQAGDDMCFIVNGFEGTTTTSTSTSTSTTTTTTSTSTTTTVTTTSTSTSSSTTTTTTSTSTSSSTSTTTTTTSTTTTTTSTSTTTTTTSTSTSSSSSTTTSTVYPYIFFVEEVKTPILDVQFPK